MKTLYCILAACFLTAGLPLFAQSETTKEAGATAETDSTDITEEVVIPTEVSEAPYELGDLVTQQGYYIDRGEELPQLNIRIVGNKFRLYWIDENGLIAEPEHSSAIIRFFGANRGVSYLRLSSLPSGVGLGSPQIMAPPHLYNAILVFGDAESGAAITHPFRYTINLDKEVDPTLEPDS